MSYVTPAVMGDHPSLDIHWRTEARYVCV